MQMIDVLKRLAELDAANPNRPEYKVQSKQNVNVNEDAKIDECGMMGGMDRPSTPASINMTAATGEELSAMLKDIMTLAGRPADQAPMGEPMGGADGVAVVDVEPDMDAGMGPSMDNDADDTSVMRSMIDKLNPELDGDDQEEPEDDQDGEKKVDEWDNEPTKATDVPGMDQDSMLSGEHNRDQSGSKGAARGRGLVNHPVAAPEATYESLMAEYKKFISEDQGMEEGSVHGFSVAKYYQKNNDQRKIINWLRKNAELPKDQTLHFDDADLIWQDSAGNSKPIVLNALGDPKIKFNDLLTAVIKAAGSSMAPKTFQNNVYREEQDADRNEVMNDLVYDAAKELGVNFPVSYDVAQKIAQKIEAGSSDTPYWNQKEHTADDILLWMDNAKLIGQDSDGVPDDVANKLARYGIDVNENMDAILKLSGLKR